VVIGEATTVLLMMIESRKAVAGETIGIVGRTLFAGAGMMLPEYLLPGVGEWTAATLGLVVFALLLLLSRAVTGDDLRYLRGKLV
jgi:hypothetical protein